MTDYGIKRLILVTALEADVQGMVADNKEREQNGLTMAYTGEDFANIAEQMREIAEKPEELL